MQELDFGFEEQMISPPTAVLTTQQMDALVKDMLDKKAEYDLKKDISNAANEAYEEARARLLGALDAAGKSKYHVDGLGTVSKVTTYKVTTPKDIGDKKKMLTYFRQQGPEVYLSLVSVPYQSLNSYFNQEAEAAQARGEVFSIPGVEAPVASDNIRFTKERKKG